MASHERLFNGEQVRLQEDTCPHVNAMAGTIDDARCDVAEVFEVKLPVEPIQMLSPRLRYPEQASRFVMEVGEVADDEKVDSSPTAETETVDPIHDDFEKRQSAEPAESWLNLAEAIQEGERAIFDGRTRSAKDVFAEMRAKHGF